VGLADDLEVVAPEGEVGDGEGEEGEGGHAEEE
jgi:hypothetical protein